MNKLSTKIIGAIASSCLLFLSTPAFTKEAPKFNPSSHKTYIGLFGGYTGMMGADLSQHGTVFFTEALGGALPVEAFGSSGKPTSGLLGGHIGVSWSNQCLAIMPAIELEGYYMGNIKIEENLINTVTRPFRLGYYFLMYGLSQ